MAQVDFWPHHLHKCWKWRVSGFGEWERRQMTSDIEAESCTCCDGDGSMIVPTKRGMSAIRVVGREERS